KEHFGSLDATYGDKFRVGRDDKSWPLGGGGGNLGITTLRNVGFGQEKPDHTRWGQSGQTSTQIVVMSKPIQSWTYVPIGQSDRPASPHYADQAEKLFSPAVLKSTWWTPEALYAHIESREALHPEAAAPPAAAGDVAEILGIWKLTMELQGNQVPATMVLSEQDGKLAGTWEDTFGKDDLYDIVYRGNALTLGRDVTYQGQDYAIDFEGKITDGVLKGTFFTDAGPLDVAGTLEGAAAPATASITGTWDALVEFEGEQHPSKMTVTQNADGSYSVAISDEYGAQPPYDVTFEINTLSFKRKVEYQGETPEITFEAKIEGDTLTGEYTTEIGTLPVKAARAAAPAEAAAPAPAGDVQAALGTWELSIEIQGSSFPATLTLTQGADGALVGAWQDQYSTTPPDNVAFKEGTLTFTRKVPYQGQEYTLQFEGKIAGDALTGEFSTGTFVMPATGKRAAAAPSTPAPEAPAPAPATGIQSLLGEWEGKMEYQGSHYPAKMSFSQGADGALTGTWADEFTTKPPYDITFENGTLTFSRTLDYQGTEYTLKFEGKVEGDTIKGEFSTDVGPIPLTATRAAAAASAPAPAPEPAPAVPAPAAADISALVGDWAVTIEFQGSSFPASMSFTQAASGALEGAWKDEYSTTAPYDIKFENGALSFARKIEYQGQEYTITFEGKLDGDTITGEYETEMGPLPVTAKRVATPGAPPAASADTFLGDWDVAVDIQGSALPAKLGIAQGADGQLSGTWSDEYSSTAPYNVRVAEGKLQFDRKVEVQGQEYVIAFEGAVEGDTLTGAYHTEMGDLPVTGKRAAAPSPAAADSGLPGEWNITTVSQLGTLERTLLIAPDLSGWYGVDERRFPLQNLKQDGKKLVFDVTVSVQGTEVPLHFEGEADSGKISGVFSTPYGNATVTGTKKATEAAAGDASGEVRQVLEQWKKAMEAGELDQAMTFYSDDFASTEGGDKAGTRDYLQSAKDSGYLDGLKIALEDTEVAVDGDTATIKNISAEGGFGVVALNFTAKKQDGKWLFTELQ
ncbi:MAG: penicillin acylase family protein, partial [Candidatus Hydrogenedentes bacterium]|nr:penicillin acylase family protein [Candidatus Hydrogenedentota bacterium]